MTDFDDRERAVEPEDLGRLFLERANARDIEGGVGVYEPDAVLASAGGNVVTGSEAIRGVYEALLTDPPQFTGDVRPALHRGDLALTSTRFSGRDSRDREAAKRRHLAVGYRSAERPRIAMPAAVISRVLPNTRREGRQRRLI
ncbi:MAG: YybH family protein [Nocardioidaceae bacterium]